MIMAFCFESVIMAVCFVCVIMALCFVSIRMASPNTAGQKKIKSSDGPKVAPTTPVRPFAGLMMPSTPVESSSGTNHPPYHVFINHCGQDTKYTLADRIYKDLTATGLRVFLDKDELERGDYFPEVLENAIANASLHIAIFSTNYVKSCWCLAELAFMLQTGAKIIPIFYLIEPSTLRWGFTENGIYANDFYQHERKNRYSPDMLKSWKSALHKVSHNHGEIINNECDEEATLMNVVSCVLKELKRVRLDVAQHPVGLDEVEQDFHKKIVIQSTGGSIQIVGIWGMGGAGKTTLAKHLYNKKCSTFKRSSFIFDIRDAAYRGRLHEKQKKLLQDLNLNDESANFDNMDEGKGILRSRLRSISVLIVLDDVDHKDQLDALLPKRDNLGHGSLIIVTTRELNVLKACDISAIYKIRPLDPSDAEELFCWYAFGQPSPFIDFKELAKKFINACCGLPLSLKVLGSLLHGESSKKYWQSQLHKLSRIVPEDIKMRLRISYDALDDEEKEMFLDVACFFIGWPSNSAIAVWDGSGWSGLHGWQKLVNKCLVEFLDNEIRMHDHLRDLGREIANKQSPYRIWSKQWIIKIQSQQEPIQIRGMADAFGDNCFLRDGKIILNTSQGKRKLPLGSLGLKIFIGQGNFINEECSELSTELLCFRCFRFGHINLPSWLPLKKLRILNLSKPQKLEDLWECDEDAPSQLRQLIIDGGFELKKISHLQRLRSLETLKIHMCTELKTLPSLSEATSSLKEIVLSRCTKLEKIESLESLRSLEKLTIRDCTELNTLPSLAEATSSLKEIKLSDCTKLEKIESLETLRPLEKLTIRYCTELNTLPSLAEATSSLKEILLSWCTKLEKIESLESLRSLEKLTIEYCTELNTLPSLAEATSLKKNELSRCTKLEKIESLESLRSLEKLRIDDCTELNTLPSLAEATSSLKEIVLSSCTKLEKIESLESLRSLEKLRIDKCTELNTLPSLAEATSSLKEIELSSCTKLDTLPSLAELTCLEEFVLTGCKKVEKVEGLEVLRSLKKVKVHMCSMRPSMLKLPQQSKRLESVEVVANRVVIEPSKQKWGREVIICTRAVIDVMSLRNFFTSFPLNNVVGHGSSKGLTFRMPESTDNANAILICFVVDSILPISFQISTDKYNYFCTSEMSKGEWVWMGIFPQESDLLQSQRYEIIGEVEEGWILRGTEQRIREAFSRLSQS